MKAPSQDFTVLSRGLFLFFSAFAFMGRCGAFRGLGVRLPSRDVKGVLQLTYGGERGAFQAVRLFLVHFCSAAGTIIRQIAERHHLIHIRVIVVFAALGTLKPRNPSS